MYTLYHAPWKIKRTGPPDGKETKNILVEIKRLFNWSTHKWDVIQGLETQKDSACFPSSLCLQVEVYLIRNKINGREGSKCGLILYREIQGRIIRRLSWPCLIHIYLYMQTTLVSPSTCALILLPGFEQYMVAWSSVRNYSKKKRRKKNSIIYIPSIEFWPGFLLPGPCRLIGVKIRLQEI